MSGYGGRTTSPIIDGDLLIMGMLNSSWGYQGMGRTRFVAFNKKTGSVVWWGSGGYPPKNSYYSIPVVAVIGGERLDYQRRRRRLRSRLQGSHRRKSLELPVRRPGRQLFAGGVRQPGLHRPGRDQLPDSPREGRIICVDGSIVENGQPKLIWKKDGIRVKFASPILEKGRLYVCNDTPISIVSMPPTARRYGK